jgi:hypothetical protein
MITSIIPKKKTTKQYLIFKDKTKKAKKKPKNEVIYNKTNNKQYQ